MNKLTYPLFCFCWSNRIEYMSSIDVANKKYIEVIILYEQENLKIFSKNYSYCLVYNTMKNYQQFSCFELTKESDDVCYNSM